MDDRIIYDKENMRDVLKGFPKMVEDAQHLTADIKPDGALKNIFVLGMGGSGFAGDLLKTYVDTDLPVIVNKGYELPKYADRESLVFAISYSGNTEETITAYRSLIKRGVRNIVAISSGGKLQELSELNKNPFIKVPGGIQPRLSTPYLFFPMLNVLTQLGIVQGTKPNITELVKSLHNPAIEKKAIELAKKLKDRIPVIYSSDRFFCVAEKWKTDINENAKTMACYNVFPEFNHNEINGYINLTGKFHVVMLKDAADHERVVKRFAIIKRLIMSKGVDVTEIAISGDDFLTRLLSSIYMGLWVSYHLALEYKTDPTPVDIIEDLKRDLKA